MLNRKVALAFAMLLGILLGAGALYYYQGAHSQKASTLQATVGMYYCPMHPQVIRDHPDSCPLCGMDLVPAKEHTHTNDTEEKPDGAVRVDPAMVQSMGVRTAVVTQTRLVKKIHMPGSVVPDPARQAMVTTRVMGWIENVAVSATGNWVNSGQTLVHLYSPDLVAAQEEYLQVLARGDPQLQARARDRLLNLGMPVAWIDTTKVGGKTIRAVPLVAPMSGVVRTVGVITGQQVMPGEPLFTIANYSQVWVLGKAYAEDWQALQVGAPVMVQSGNTSYTGRIDMLYPEVEAATQIATVRVVVANRGRFPLRPGQNAQLLIEQLLDSTVVVPVQAILRTGVRDVAILALGNGWFAPRIVQLGQTSGDSVQVLSGLQTGDSLVLSGQFLIDGESNLSQAVERMKSGGAQP